jgi:DNA-directed RNA polymerase subunit M/transcription elongation factor TFIIS
MGYDGDWRLIKEAEIENPNFKCHKCGDRSHLETRTWDSYDEAHTDYQYRCLKCGSSWWVEGSDY